MAPELTRIETELTEARRRAHVLAGPLDQEAWARRPAPGTPRPTIPVRLRTKTTAPFVPRDLEPKALVLDAFDRLQGELIGCLGEANGLDLGRLRIVSPFVARIKYNLYSCLRIIPAHQRLHLAQAEEVIRGGSGTHG